MGIPRRVQELWGAYNKIEPNSVTRRILDTRAGRLDASRSNFLSTLDSAYSIDALASLGNTIRARVLGVVSVVPSRTRFPDIYERTVEALDGDGKVEQHYIFSLRSELDFLIRNPDNEKFSTSAVNTALMNGTAISNVPSAQFGPVGTGDIVEVYLPNNNSYRGARVVGVTIRNNVAALDAYADVLRDASGPFAALAGAGGAAGGFAGGAALGGAGVGIMGGFNPNVGLGNYETDPNDDTRSLYLSSLWVEEERSRGWKGGGSAGRKRYNNPYGSTRAIFKPDGPAAYGIPSINDQPDSIGAIRDAYPGLSDHSAANITELADKIHPGRLLRNFIKWCAENEDEDIVWRDGETKRGGQIYTRVMQEIWANDKENYITSNDPGTRAVGWFREWNRAPVRERKWPRNPPTDRMRQINIGVELRRIFHGHSSNPPADPAYPPGILDETPSDPFSNQYCAYICWDAWAQALGEMGLRLIYLHPNEKLLKEDKSDYIDNDAKRRYEEKTKEIDSGSANRPQSMNRCDVYIISRNLHMGLDEPRRAQFEPWNDPERYFPIQNLPYHLWGQTRNFITSYQFNQLLIGRSTSNEPQIAKYLEGIQEPDALLSEQVYGRPGAETNPLPGGLMPGDIMSRARDTLTRDQLGATAAAEMKFIGFDPDLTDKFPDQHRTNALASESQWAKDLEYYAVPTAGGHAEMVVYVWGDGLVWQVGGNTGSGGSETGRGLYEDMIRGDNPLFLTKDNSCLIIGGPESPYGRIINPITGDEVKNADGTHATVELSFETKGRIFGYLRPQWGCEVDGPYGETAPYPSLIPGVPAAGTGDADGVFPADDIGFSVEI